jgi:hypothetical protein
LQILQHLECCDDCSAEVAVLRGLGDELRAASHTHVLPPGLDGLAGTVTSRSRAEAAQSWRAVFQRAREDWHWVIVGAGSVAATFFCTVALSALLAFGPSSARDDSLAAMMSNLDSPAGMLFLYATPDGTNDPLLLQVDNGGPAAPRVVAALAARSGDNQVSEAELVSDLAALMTRQGRVVSLDAMTPAERQRAEHLLEQITRLRMAEWIPNSTTAFNVHQVRLVTSTSVTAKGL